MMLGQLKIKLDDEKEKAMILININSREKEWQLPAEKQGYDNDNDNGGMYKIELEDGSELLVSEEHKVYSSNKSYENQAKSSIMSLFNRTSTSDCLLNLGSFDQIGQFNFNASAKNGISLSCIRCLAFASNSLNDSLGIIFINVSNSDNFFSNPFVSNPEYFNTSCLFFLNSSIASSGTSNCKLRDFDLEMISLTGFDLKKDTNTFVSGTNLIFYQPSFLYLSHMPFFILSPISRASSSNSLSESNCCNICSFQANLLAFDSIVNLTSADQFISGNLFINSLVSSGTDNVIEGILLQSYLNNVKKQKYVEVFKSFDLKSIKEVYSNFEDGEEIWFLDVDNNPVRVKSITKQKYNGKIYDVDVENDIVLVRRRSQVLDLGGKSSDVENDIVLVRRNNDANSDADILDSNKYDNKLTDLVDRNNDGKLHGNSEKLGKKQGEKAGKNKEKADENNGEIFWEICEKLGKKVTNFSRSKDDEFFRENGEKMGKK